MRLTLRRALRECRDLWTWYEEHPELGAGSKALWPGWKRYGEKYGSAPLMECPACDYMGASGLDCGRGDPCPLASIWGKVGRTAPLPCCKKSSPFHLWGHAKTDRGRRNNARKIRMAAEAELAKLKGRRMR